MLSGKLSPGDVLDGRYRVLRVIGQGGMGEVYAAERLALGDVVAIKRVIPAKDSPENRARFLREARAAAKIRHPNVVQVFDFGDRPDELPYMVMELLEGPTLEQEIEEFGRLLPDRARSLMSRIASAVEAGHRRGVVHRDLKPGNVILARHDDGRETVKVLDFGLAWFTGMSAPGITRPGAVLGTSFYMAPEQINGRKVGPTSDVFSLGVMLYEMVTGKLPFEASSVVGTVAAILQGKYPPPDSVVPDLPRSIVEAIAAALSLDPARRPATPEALARLAGCAMTVRPPARQSDRVPSLRAEVEALAETQGSNAGPEGGRTVVDDGLAGVTKSPDDADDPS